jgi:hypothetical protein
MEAFGATILRVLAHAQTPQVMGGHNHCKSWVGNCNITQTLTTFLCHIPLKLNINWQLYSTVGNSFTTNKFKQKIY